MIFKAWISFSRGPFRFWIVLWDLVLEKYTPQSPERLRPKKRPTDIPPSPKTPAPGARLHVPWWRAPTQHHKPLRMPRWFVRFVSLPFQDHLRASPDSQLLGKIWVPFSLTESITPCTYCICLIRDNVGGMFRKQLLRYSPKITHVFPFDNVIGDSLKSMYWKLMNLCTQRLPISRRTVAVWVLLWRKIICKPCIFMFNLCFHKYDRCLPFVFLCL